MQHYLAQPAALLVALAHAKTDGTYLSFLERAVSILTLRQRWSWVSVRPSSMWAMWWTPYTNPTPLSSYLPKKVCLRTHFSSVLICPHSRGESPPEGTHGLRSHRCSRSALHFLGASVCATVAMELRHHHWRQGVQDWQASRKRDSSPGRKPGDRGADVIDARAGRGRWRQAVRCAEVRTPWTRRHKAQSYAIAYFDTARRGNCSRLRSPVAASRITETRTRALAHPRTPRMQARQTLKA